MGSVYAMVTELPPGARARTDQKGSMYCAVAPECVRILRAESGEAVILAARTDEIERTIALTNLRLERTWSIVLEGIYVRLIKLKNDAGQARKGARRTA
jgi:hypothetical protein